MSLIILQIITFCFLWRIRFTVLIHKRSALFQYKHSVLYIKEDQAYSKAKWWCVTACMQSDKDPLYSLSLRAVGQHFFILSICPRHTQVEEDTSFLVRRLLNNLLFGVLFKQTPSCFYRWYSRFERTVFLYYSQLVKAPGFDIT